MSQENNDYIPGFIDSNGNKVKGREVTDTFGRKMAEIILAEPNIHKMYFPRLRFSRAMALGYSAADYYKIAHLILSKDIKVYETSDSENSDYVGAYLNSNRFIFTQKLTSDPQKYLGTIVHETTHAIQDLKKWRESDRDREVDAHFAAAYFMVLKGQEGLLKTSRYSGYISLAKKIKENPKYFKTIEFNQKLRDLQSSINQEYGWKFRDDPDKLEDFHKRQRWDGIAN